jgi:hypothetical protein
VQQLVRRVIAQPREALAEQPLARSGVTEPVALQLEEAEFLRAIEDAQVQVELQAIDDGRRLGEQDVLGPQVPVRLDDTAARIRPEQGRRLQNAR